MAYKAALEKNKVDIDINDNLKVQAYVAGQLVMLSEKKASLDQAELTKQLRDSRTAAQQLADKLTAQSMVNKDDTLTLKQAEAMAELANKTDKVTAARRTMPETIVKEESEEGKLQALLAADKTLLNLQNEDKALQLVISGQEKSLDIAKARIAIDEANRKGNPEDAAKLLKILDQQRINDSDKRAEADAVTLQNLKYQYDALQLVIDGRAKDLAQATLMVDLEKDTTLPREQAMIKKIMQENDLLELQHNKMQEIQDIEAASLNDLGTLMDNFFATGKLGWADFAKSVVADIDKIIIEAEILKPLKEGLSGSSSGGTGSGLSGLFSSIGSSIGGLFGGGGGDVASMSNFTDIASMYAANGAAFDGGVQAFADGGIVNGPTLFPMGLMGEAGPEAIMPLTRTSDGKLGVKHTGPTQGHTYITMNIQTPNADSFMKSQSQILLEMNTAANRASRRNG